MSNTIQIKRGNGKPDGKLAPYELGVQINDNNKLFIGGPDGKLGEAQQVKVEYAVTADEAVSAKTAETAAEANTAKSAEKLKSTITIQTDLTSNQAANFDGTSNIQPGITGILPISHGGFGGSTKEEALSNLGIDLSQYATIEALNTKANISGYTASRVLISNSSGTLTTSSNITTSELGFLNGVTSNIQEQINNIVQIEQQIGTVSGNSTKNFNFDPNNEGLYVFAVLITLKGSGSTTLSGIWDLSNSGQTNQMYGYLGSGTSVNTFPMTVTLNGATVQVARGGSASLTVGVTAILKRAAG